MSGRVGVVREACIFLHFGESLGSWQRQAGREEKMVLGQCYGLCEGVPLKICVPNTLLSMQIDCLIEKLNFMCVFFFCTWLCYVTKGTLTRSQINEIACSAAFSLPNVS